MRRAWQSWVFAVLAVVIAVCVATLSTRFGFTVDWSAGARATVTPESRELLARLPGPIEVVSYARPGELRAKTGLLVARYRRFKPDLKLVFVDPDLHPAATTDAGITSNGEIVLRWHGLAEHVTQLDEQDFSDALARLARGGTHLVAFVTGDGERDFGTTGLADLGDFIGRLAARGVRALPLNLAEAAEVPRNTSVVVLASPQAALLPASVQKLEDYVANGGNLLWLTEPGSDDLGLAPLARTLGVKRLAGALLDRQGTTAAAGDPGRLVATHYPPQAITRGFGLNTLFPQAAALAALAGAGWDAQPILESSAQSWSGLAPTAPTGSAAAGADPGPDALKGPLTFGYALSRLSPSPDKTRQRVVVIGDGDFLSNAYLAEAGNLAFGERVLDWLLGDDALVGLPRAAPDTVVTPTHADFLALAFGYFIALPVILILIGWAIAWRRRRR